MLGNFQEKPLFSAPREQMHVGTAAAVLLAEVPEMIAMLVWKAGAELSALVPFKSSATAIFVQVPYK